MTTRRRVDELYHAALERPKAEREAFLSEACAGDAALLREVEELLRFADDAKGILNAPAADAETARLAVAPGTRLGRYEVVQRIGAGGMGEVHRARDTRLGREVALKVLPGGQSEDEEARARFEREARAIASLSHPNVCALHDVGRHDGVDYLVLELLEGETLADRLERGALALEQALETARAIAEALEAAHARGIVHRDLKPANVHVSTGGHVKVMDFGLARSLPGAVREDAAGATEFGTREGVILGTTAYMSPEQARGQTVDARADLWALGCVLFESLTGQRAFSGGTVSDTLAAVLEREPDWDALPTRTPPSVRELLRRCLEKNPERRPGDAAAVRGELEQAVGPRRHGPRAEGGGAEETSPYPGLASFGEADAERFFGREAEVEALWAKLRQRNLLGLIGPSGAGKTSFLQAGLVPSRPEGWGAVVCRPGDAPLLRLGQALTPQLLDDPGAVKRLFRFEDPEVAFDVVARWRRRHDQALLIVDAFEELFTQNPPEVQARFAALLGRLAGEADLHVLVSMRDDFLFQCHAHDALAPLFSELTPLGPPGGAALRRAVVRPAEDLGYHFEDEALVEELLEGLAEERGALPLLAFAMARLWERRDRDRGLLTREAYVEIGGVAGALARHAEATLGRLGSERHGLVRELLRNLITSQGTRAARDVEELLSVFPNREPAEAVLRELIAARLITAFEVPGGEGEPERRRVEIVHESLLRAWPRLVRWQAQDADGAQLRDQLRQAAAAWEARGRPEDLLWTGTAVKEYRLWRERYPGRLTVGEEAFATAMVAWSERRRRQVRAAVGAGMAALLVVSLVLFRAQQEAVAEARRAEASKVLAFAQLQVDRDPTLALAYATRSLELSDTQEGRLFALETLQSGPIALLTPSTAETDFSHRLDFSPDGAWLAMGGYYKVKLQPRDGGTARIFAAYEPKGQIPVDVAFGPRGDVLATYRLGDELRLWSVGELLRRPRTPTERGAGAERTSVVEVEPELIQAHAAGRPWQLVPRGDRFFTFTPEGDEELIHSWLFRHGEPRLIGRRRMGAGADVDSTGTRLLDVQGRDVWLRSLEDWTRPGRVVARHQTENMGQVRIHPAGDRFASSDNEGKIRLWTPRPEGMATGRVLDADGVWLYGFDPKGTSLVGLARRSDLSEVRLWDLAGPPGADPLSVRPGSNAFNDAAFDPSGKWLVTTHAVDGEAYWPLDRDYARVLRGHESLAFDVEFTPDGKRLVSVGRDGVRVWPLSGEAGESGDVIFRENLQFPFIALDDTGGRLAVATRSGSVFVVPLDGSEPLELRGFSSETSGGRAIAFEPGGRRLAAGVFSAPAAEKVIRVWDLEAGTVTVLGPLEGETDGGGGFLGLKFTPDGNLLSGSGGAVPGRIQSPGSGLRLWNVEQGTAELLDPRRINDVSLSHDGRALLYARVPADHEVVKGDWGVELVFRDLESGETHVLDGYGRGQRRPLSLDRTGMIAVAGDEDGVVYVGRVAGNPAPHLRFGHDGEVRSVAISPDARWIASIGADRTIRLWPMPDLDRRPFHTLPHDTLLERLQALTNRRVIEDPHSPTGYREGIGPFPGWEVVPAW